MKNRNLEEMFYRPSPFAASSDFFSVVAIDPSYGTADPQRLEPSASRDTD